MDKQVESCILNIPCEKLSEIMFSPKLEFARIMPCSVKAQTLLKGSMSDKGCVLKLQMWDNSECEIEIVHRDPAKFKIAYKILKSTKPHLQDCEVTCSMRMRPVTFCGCPFLQAVHDKKCEGMSCKTYFEWRTKTSKPLTMEQWNMVRSDKLTVLSDLMKDLSGEMAMMSINAKKE